MSLKVRLYRFKMLNFNQDMYALFDFRGDHRFSGVICQSDENEIVIVNQKFEWTVSRPIDPGEVILLRLLCRSRWNTTTELGVYRLGLQILVSDGQLYLTDTLVNEDNSVVPVFVDMEIAYRAPPEKPRKRSKNQTVSQSLPVSPESTQSVPSIHGAIPKVKTQKPGGSVSKLSLRDSRPGSSRSSIMPGSDLSSDENMMIEIERNIESLDRAIKEKETKIDMPVDGVEETRAQKLKKAGKRFLKRGFTLGGGGADKPALPTLPKERKRQSALKTVKTLMRLGRSRNRCSYPDEEMGLLDTAGRSNDTDRSSQVSGSSDEAIPDIHSPIDTPKKKMQRVINAMGCPVTLKAADFQVCVTVIEARQLAGLNMDPVVCVQIGEVRKFTSVKESTNCPYYNEYFVFDFHMPPVMLFDKIITLSVLQSRHILRANKLLGNFKLDVATVWSQPDRQFYHKWALLTDPDDVTSGAKGYLKCDISVIGKGDTIKIPPKSEKDEDDIEANLLVPSGVPVERQRARFIVRIHKADGLPKMNYSLIANVKQAITGEKQNLVDPYVQVSFAGMTGSTSVRKSTYSPVWNEQIVFSEMFPPLCQRIKIELRDSNPVHPITIGTHFIDIKTISNDGDRGFLPTYGPAYIHLYGSTRDYSLMDQHASLNVGMGEGVSYRGRIFLSISTEIIDNLEYPSSEVEVETIPPITETAFEKHEQFFLFASIFEANMIDKRLIDKPLQFEVSIGNSGNSLDGNNDAEMRPRDYHLPPDEQSADTGFWLSTTKAMKATSRDRNYYFLPYWNEKQCMQVRSVWPDHRRRMFNSNLIDQIIERFEEGLTEVELAIENDSGPDTNSLVALKKTLEVASNACSNYVTHMTNAPPFGNTKLDRDRQKLCLYEIEQIAAQTKGLKALITKHSLKDRLRTAYNYVNKLKHLCEDSQHAMPDVFIWLISNGKRLAYYRLPARSIMHSENSQESGKFCGKMQTVFLKWPGKKGTTPSGWAIPTKISVYLWLSVVHDKKHFVDGLPPGYEESNEILRADNLYFCAPTTILYKAKHIFQMRAYIYQARSLIGSDSSGLSDPFARIVISDSTATTQVIDETLSPTWDELLVFEDVILSSTMDHIKADPPTIVIEIFDQDNVGKSEFIGRTLAKPHIKALEDSWDQRQQLPSLEWYVITRGDDRAGELLATFELLEIPPKESTLVLPDLPAPRETNGKLPIDVNKGPILPVPNGIRPTLSKYRIEILFWGLRDLKRVHLLTVDRPRVDIECAGNILYSSVIQNAKRNPNFCSPVKYIDVELPDQDLYRPPLTIRVVDCRSFGRVTLVGTHTINSIHKYIYTPMSKRERDIEDRKKSLIPLENIDLRANCIIQDDAYAVENEKENCPLLKREGRPSNFYGSGAKPQTIRKKMTTLDYMKKRKASTDSVFNDDDTSKDWWTKYFASVESMIEEEKEAKRERQGPHTSHGVVFEEICSPREEAIHSPRSDRGRNKRRTPTSPRTCKVSSTITPKKIEIPKSAITKILPHELETVPEYEEFKEWLHSFELYRGKKTGDDTEDENRVVGIYKGAIKVYKWPIPKGIDDHTLMGFDPNFGFFQGVPNNEPIHVLVRVYVVKATDLHPMDFNGKADPYIVLHLGSKKISDKENYVSKQLNPVFGKCFEIEATFPQDSMLTIQVLDWDLLGSDDMIGETKIDLENRFYSRHRATCGLPTKYEEQGYNRWRDAMKPTQILAKLCKDGKIDPPIYEYGRVRVGRTIFNMPVEDSELFSNADTLEEQMALVVLHRWQEVPRVGTRLVAEHVETRPLYNPHKPGIEQGRLEMWVDMFPMDMPLPGPPMDISPRKPESYEMRVIIWNTDDVVLEDDEFFTGEKMSDIYVKGWLKGPDDCQSTDIHYRSLTGEGNFNWRFIYPFDYLEAEERIVISRKETMFSWDETECKIPARLELQVWDADHFTTDDFLGAITLDLSRFPRGAKSSKLCTLEMLRNDGSVPMINIFKQKRVKGWWPFYIKRDTEEMELTGKVEAEIHLLTRDDAEKVPAGLGRNEPDPLDKPNRPDSSFMWILNPLKSIRYILWHNHKWTILRTTMVLLLALFIFMLAYAFPGYTVKKLLGA